MQSFKVLAAIIVALLTAGIQNPANAITKNQISLANLEVLNAKQLTTKQSMQISLNDVYWGPERDFRIMIPGKVITNETYQITSVSATGITYTVIHRDFPQASRIPIPQVRQVLQTAMRETIGLTGKVVRSTNLVIDSHPGLELLMEHSDGSLGQYRAFVVNQRIYFMGALTADELTTESANFFDSFQVYP